MSWLEERAALTPAAPALEVGDLRLDFAGLAAAAQRLAATLGRAGIGPGDLVAALLQNGAGFALLLHALDRCGAALLPLSGRLAPPELAFQLRDAGARLLVSDPTLAEVADAALAECPHVARARLGDDGALDAPRSDPAGDPTSALAVLYTSGTTGRPKGVPLGREQLFASAAASAFQLGAPARDRWLACMPLCHVAGLSILVRTLLAGSAAVVHERFDPERASQALDRDAISVVSLAAPMLEWILDARGDRPPPGTLRLVLLGGGPAPPSLLERARAAGFPVAVSYGLTEAASQVATRPPPGPGEPSAAALPPLFGTALRCLAADDRDAAPGEPGEILVRGPTVMQGYRNRPLESAEALLGGWLHTGDVGALDPRGHLTVLDRRSDLIVSGGENVYPAEVEAALLEHPAVLEAGVAGVDDRRFGRRPAAWLVVRGERPDEEALRAFCRSRLAGFKVPVSFCFVAALPRAPSGKLLRRELFRAAEGASGGSSG